MDHMRGPCGAAGAGAGADAGLSANFFMRARRQDQPHGSETALDGQTKHIRVACLTAHFLVHQFSTCTNPPSSKRLSCSLSDCTNKPGCIRCSPILALHESTIHQEPLKYRVLSSSIGSKDPPYAEPSELILLPPPLSPSPPLSLPPCLPLCLSLSPSLPLPLGCGFAGW